MVQIVSAALQHMLILIIVYISYCTHYTHTRLWIGWLALLSLSFSEYIVYILYLVGSHALFLSELKSIIGWLPCVAESFDIQLCDVATALVTLNISLGVVQGKVANAYVRNCSCCALHAGAYFHANVLGWVDSLIDCWK